MFTVIITKPPFADSDAKLALDMAMIAVSMDQETQILFQGEGVLQLLALQSDALEQKSPLAKYRVLTDIFEFSSLYACQQSIVERQLNEAELSLAVSVLNAEDYQQRLNRATKVVRF